MFFRDGLTLVGLRLDLDLGRGFRHAGNVSLFYHFKKNNDLVSQHISMITPLGLSLIGIHVPYDMVWKRLSSKRLL